MQAAFLKRVPWSALGTAWLVLISGSWAADGLKGETLFGEWWPVFATYSWLGTLIAVVLFVVTSVWLYRNRQAFALVRSLSRHRCEPHASLILLVSPPSMLPATRAPLFPLRLDNKERSVELLGVSLAADIKALSAVRWNWQQLLRAIEPHTSGNTLRRLHLIGSPGPAGSFVQLPLCREIVAQYLPQVEIVVVNEAVDFEDFNALVQCMHKIIAEEKHAGMQERDVVIDVTGGFKTASIAGASITFNSQVSFQYVQTVVPHEVYAYDVIYQPPAAEG